MRGDELPVVGHPHVAGESVSACGGANHDHHHQQQEAKKQQRQQAVLKVEKKNQYRFVRENVLSTRIGICTGI